MQMQLPGGALVPEQPLAFGHFVAEVLLEKRLHVVVGGDFPGLFLPVGHLCIGERLRHPEERGQFLRRSRRIARQRLERHDQHALGRKGRRPALVDRAWKTAIDNAGLLQEFPHRLDVRGVLGKMATAAVGDPHGLVEMRPEARIGTANQQDDLGLGQARMDFRDLAGIQNRIGRRDIAADLLPLYRETVAIVVELAGFRKPQQPAEEFDVAVVEIGLLDLVGDGPARPLVIGPVDHTLEALGFLHRHRHGAVEVVEFLHRRHPDAAVRRQQVVEESGARLLLADADEIRAAPRAHRPPPKRKPDAGLRQAARRNDTGRTSIDRSGGLGITNRKAF